MHKASGQSHSRTSPAIQVTCFPDADSFPLPRVAFHLVSVIHLSFSRQDRDSCVADTSPLCFFILLSFFLCVFFQPFLALCVALSLFIHVFCLPTLCFLLKALHIVTSCHARQLFPKKQEHIAWGAHMWSNLLCHGLCTQEGVMFEVRFY